MKKHKGFTLANMMALVAIAAVLAITAVPTIVLGVPTSKTLTLPGGGTNTVTFAYTEGIGRDVYTSFKPLAFQIVLDTAAPDVATVTVARAASGPAYHTATVASNGTTKVSFETNDWYFLRGDTWEINCTSTNSGTVTAIGDEQ